jgi:cytoskeletal protein CcmA (bactofilin family)
MHVAQKAQSATCPSCYKRQTVQDVIVDTDKTGARVETTGILFIKRKGRVWAPGVKAGDAVEVLGELKANVETHGHVVIGETARWKGDCKARLLIVEDGARIDGGYFCIDPDGEIARSEIASAPSPGSNAASAPAPSHAVPTLPPSIEPKLQIGQSPGCVKPAA